MANSGDASDNLIPFRARRIDASRCDACDAIERRFDDVWATIARIGQAIQSQGAEKAALIAERDHLRRRVAALASGAAPVAADVKP